MRQRDWCTTVVSTIGSRHSCAICTDCAFLNASSFVWPFLCSAAAGYLARDLQWADDDISRRPLRSATTHKLVVRCTQLRTIGDRAFGAAAPRVWNNLPTDVVTASSVATFKQRLKTFLFTQSFDVWRTVTFVVTCLWSLGLRQARWQILAY